MKVLALISTVALAAAELPAFSELNKLSDAEISEQMKALFPKVDLNGDGKLDVEEVAKYYETKFTSSVNEAASAEFVRLDTNKDGKLDLEEVKVSLGDSNLSESDISSMERRFKASDIDGDGFLSLTEVTAMMLGGADESDAENVKRFILDHDADKNGTLSVEELLGSFSAEELAEIEKDVRGAFTAADSDKNNQLDATEVAELFAAASESQGPGTPEERLVHFTSEATALLGDSKEVANGEVPRKVAITLLAELFSEQREQEEQAAAATARAGGAGAGGAPDMDPAALENLMAELKKMGAGNGGEDLDIEALLAKLGAEEGLKEEFESKEDAEPAADERDEL